jgi:sulfur carrier protein
MKLRINGDDIEIAADVKNVADLLKYFQLQDKVVIVEHNREILEKATHQLTTIADGDQIEIVHFVGGG